MESITAMSGFVGGVIRALGPVIVAWLVARHITPEDASNLVQYLADGAVAIVALGSALWSIIKNRQHNKVADMIAQPEIKSIEMSSALAESVSAAAPKYAHKITTPTKRHRHHD